MPPRRSIDKRFKQARDNKMAEIPSVGQQAAITPQ
jgi:hypothetical protein